MSDELRAILRTLRRHMPALRAEFSVESLAVFGSTARDEAGPESDVDLLVTYLDTPSLLEFLALQDHLESLLDRQVDLVMKTALKPRLRDRVLSESIAA